MSASARLGFRIRTVHQTVQTVLLSFCTEDPTKPIASINVQNKGLIYTFLEVSFIAGLPEPSGHSDSIASDVVILSASLRACGKR